MQTFRAATHDTFRSLGIRNYRLFFIGQLVSQVGTWMQLVALITVVLRITDDGLVLGLVTAAQFAPVLVFGAWGGVLADRVDRHRFMLRTQTAFAVVAVAFSVLIAIDRLSLVPIFALAWTFGFLTAVDNPSRRTLVVDLVGPDDVPNAVALNSTLMTGSRVIGPAAAGVLIQTVGVEWCFYVNAITYLAVIGALRMMRTEEIASSPRVGRQRGQLRAGLRYVWREPLLRRPIVLMAVIGTLAFEFQVSLPLLATRELGGSESTFTILYSMMSLGSVIGALSMARRRDVTTRLLCWGGLGIGVSMLALAASPNLALAVVAVVPVGFGTIVLISGANAVVQLRADPEMRGRVLALTAVVFIGSTPIGGPIIGWVSEAFDARIGLGVGAVSALIASAAILWSIHRDGTPPPGPPITPDRAPAVVRP